MCDSFKQPGLITSTSSSEGSQSRTPLPVSKAQSLSYENSSRVGYTRPLPHPYNCSPGYFTYFSYNVTQTCLSENQSSANPRPQTSQLSWPQARSVASLTWQHSVQGLAFSLSATWLVSVTCGRSAHIPLGPLQMFNWLVEPWPAFRSRSPAPFRLPLAPLHRFPFCFLSKLKLCSFYPTSMARMFGCWEAHKPSFTLRPIPSGESATVFL